MAEERLRTVMIPDRAGDACDDAARTALNSGIGNQIESTQGEDEMANR
jgi:hypothetical protein